MNEITGPEGPSGLHSLNSRQPTRSSSTRPGADSRESTRATDDVKLSGESLALSQISSLPEVRTEMVNRLMAEVNDPDYDLDGKFANALGVLMDDESMG